MSLIEKNDIIRVQPGVLLLDVIVISGTAKVTQSARTGSDQVLQVGKGERIESGSVVHEVTGCLAIVEKVVEQSLLIDLVTHVKFSQNEQEGQASAIETLCRRIANYFVRGVIILSTLTMLTWAFILGFSLTEVPVCDVCWIIERGIGVLVASCPCALGLAIPSVIANVLNLAIKSGILIKKTHIFEKIKKTGIVAFDKTGTLFTKINHIEDRIFLNKTMNQEQVWQILAILQRDFRHPLAEIIYRQAFRNSKITGTNFSFITLQNQFLPSQGIKAKLLNKTLQKQMTILLGNRTLLRANGIDVQGLNMQKEAHTTIYLAIDEHVQMVLYINTHSNLRPETVQVIKKIQEQGFQVHIISGDSKESVEKLGKNINLPIENLHGEHTANDKLQWISRMQSAGNMVMMIGDGLNDIPCLQQAGIGISINAKSELNINAADVVVLSENLQKVLALIRFLKRGNLFIRINLLWAFAYNLFIMPITAGALYHFSIFVSPVWSSIAMSCSSLIVVGFSHLLTVFHYDDSMIEKEGLGKEGPTMVDLTVSGREVMTLNEEIS